MRTVRELTGATVISTDRPAITTASVADFVLVGSSAPAPAYTKFPSTRRREIGLLTGLVHQRFWLIQ